MNSFHLWMKDDLCGMQIKVKHTANRLYTITGITKLFRPRFKKTLVVVKPKF